MPKVTVNDLHSIDTGRGRGYCNRGARVWFKEHNLSWADFVENGIDFEILEEIGDPMGLRAIEAAKEREALEE